MKHLFLIFTIALTFISCTAKPIKNSVISGSIKIIDNRNKDITKYCGKFIKKGGEYTQSASAGYNTLDKIVCINNYDVYMVNTGRIKVKVPSENSTVRFGSIVITLNNDGSYEVEGGNGKLVVNDTSSGWSKHNINNIAGR